MAQGLTLNEQEIQQVLDHISTRKHAARDRAMLLVSHLSGIRVWEVQRLVEVLCSTPPSKIVSVLMLTTMTSGKKIVAQIFSFGTSKTASKKPRIV